MLAVALPANMAYEKGGDRGQKGHGIPNVAGLEVTAGENKGWQGPDDSRRKPGDQIPGVCNFVISGPSRSPSLS
ncbi:hypothetical protein RRG08_036582 [Elysia crispata]|uniref:Uncharacterized protein n=1 Tax=Elysia crispata TaxID=231223 RepID=A0AAE0ZSQ9_9GAST|nr:hypothetical protein RRG08_036582 [Elysia crispata]